MLGYYKRTNLILSFFADFDKLFKDWHVEQIVEDNGSYYSGRLFYRTEINGEVIDFDRNDYLQLLAEEQNRG